MSGLLWTHEGGQHSYVFLWRFPRLFYPPSILMYGHRFREDLYEVASHPLVPDSRVEKRIRRVDDEVHQDDDGDDHQIDALDHRVVALVDGVEEEAAHAGEAEDLLEDHGAAEDLRDLEAQHGH